LVPERICASKIFTRDISIVVSLETTGFVGSLQNILRLFMTEPKLELKPEPNSKLGCHLDLLANPVKAKLPALKEGPVPNFPSSIVNPSKYLP
jgi:hypothetical protein